MELPNYPEIKDIDDLFGFSAARKKAEDTAALGAAALYEEPNYIPHRIFLNHVDSYNARHISSVKAKLECMRGHTLILL